VYTWDAANRLVGANVDGVVSAYEYDGLGNRVAQTVDGVTTEYVLDIGGGLPEVIVATTGGAGAGSNPGGVRRRGVEVRPAGCLGQRAPSDGHRGRCPWRRATIPLGSSFPNLPISQSPNLLATYPCGAQAGEWWDAGAELLYLRAL
jgi:YD repeat-containing protein